MSSFLKKGRRKSQKQNLGCEFKKYPNVKTVTMTREEMKKVIWDPNFGKRKKNEESQKRESRFIGKRPIECLELNGYEVLRDPKDVDSVMIFVDECYDFMEGICLPKDEFNFEKDENLPINVSINEKLIEDYSSLWELTLTGWYDIFSSLFKENHLYPYLYVRKKESNDDYQLWRWDNSNFLRVKCLTHNWSKENFELFEKGVLLKDNKLLYDRVVNRKKKSMKLYS